MIDVFDSDLGVMHNIPPEEGCCKHVKQMIVNERMKARVGQILKIAKVILINITSSYQW